MCENHASTMVVLPIPQRSKLQGVWVGVGVVVVVMRVGAIIQAPAL